MIEILLFPVFLYLLMCIPTFIASLLNRDEMGHKNTPTTARLLWDSLKWPVILYRSINKE